MQQAERELLMRILTSMTIADEKSTEKEKEQEEVDFFRKDTKVYVETLQSLFKIYINQNPFKVGDIVVWKEGMQNRRWPQFGQPAIVAKLIEVVGDGSTIVDDDEGETIDILLGFTSKDGNFQIFGYTSNRFKVYDEKVEQPTNK